MSARRLVYGSHARAAMQAGIDVVAEAVRMTLGPRGRYAVVDRRTALQSVKSDGLTITNDGVTVANEIEVENRFQNQGARLVREVASQTDRIAGDGTTTATVLAQAMVHDGLRNIAAGADPAALRRGIEHGVRSAVAAIEDAAIGITGREQALAIATVACKDERIGERVADAFDAVGPHGVVRIDSDFSRDRIDLEITDGMWFYNGYLSPEMITHPETGEAVLEDPYILIVNHDLTHAEQLAPVLERVAQTERPLLVVADKIEGTALGVLVQSTLRGYVRCVAVQARYLGEYRRRHLEDVALYTGGESIVWTVGARQLVGMSVHEAQLEQLGRAKRVVVTHNTTTIIDGAGEQGPIAARIAGLRREIDAAKTVYHRERLEDLLQHISGRIAIFRVGGETETEVRERSLRVEDAVRATRAALTGGITPGGGVALLEARAAIDPSALPDDEATGAEIVRAALAEPLRQIAENAGAAGAFVAARVAELPQGEGFDAATRTYTDMIEAGVIDPIEVPCAALENAASVAKVVLATETIVVGNTEEPRPQDGMDLPIKRPPKRLLYGSEAQLALRRGLERVARAVTITMGPAGRYAVFVDRTPVDDAPDVVPEIDPGRIVVTNDGVTIARQVDSPDPFEQRGVELVQDVAGATNTEAGDGTTTAILLAQALVSAGQRNVAAGAEPTAIRRGIERAVEQVTGRLREQSVQVSEQHELAWVAEISAGDREIGELVADAFTRVGRHGVVSYEEGRTTTIELDVEMGMHWANGVLDREMILDRPRRESALERPYVLCTDLKITEAAQLAGLLGQVAETERPLLLVVGAVEPEPLAMLLANNAKGVLTSVAVRAHGFGEERRRSLEDLATLTGGTAVTQESGLTLEAAGLEHLGRARRAVATLRGTTVIDGAGSTEAVDERIKAIEALAGAEGISEVRRERMRERVARLGGGIAVLKVGAPTEAEARERLLRVEDAVRAVRGALKEGIVPGGGIALLRCRDAVDPTGLPRDEAIGSEIVREALEQPLRQIARNAGVDEGLAVARAIKLGGAMGLDALTGSFVDLLAAGVVDPTLVVRSALENAASVAKTILLAECVVVEAETNGARREARWEI